MIVVGIDPGKNGAMAMLYPDDAMLVWDVPKIKVGSKEVPAWTEWGEKWGSALEFAKPDLVVIENVSARPKEGSVSGFNFGRVLGFAHALAVASGAQVAFVTPTAWKGKMALLKSDKNASREKYRTLFPRYACHVTRVKDDGRAEAGLLAYYGRKYL